jgi:hypothetical protein
MGKLLRFREWTKRLMRIAPVRKKTEVTIETDHVVTIRRRDSLPALCPRCGCELPRADPKVDTALPRQTEERTHW